MSFSRWVGIGAAAGLIAALVPVVRGSVDLHNPLAKSAKSWEPPRQAALTGLDLTRLDIRPNRVTSPLSGGRQAELTLDPVVQRVAERTMRKYRVPEAGVVALEAKTGRVIAYASQKSEGEKVDVNLQAGAPAASVFKIVTSAALVEKAGLNHRTEQCYRGGKSSVTADELRENPERDKWCATLGIAMGRSLNVVFARLAQKHLTPEDLTQMGGAFGFGAKVPFVVEGQTSLIEVPDDPLEFARTAAGFWNTTMSPLEAALIAQTVANGGVTLQPRIVRAVVSGKETLWTAPDEPLVLRRAVKKETAAELTKMMVHTVSGGSAFKAFHDQSGRSFLPDIEVAGKTGTLTDHEAIGTTRGSLPLPRPAIPRSPWRHLS
jgi:cell division protein FtsI/penicillin-binding protein 2